MSAASANAPRVGVDVRRCERATAAIVNFAHVALECTDQVKMRPAASHAPMHDRRRRRGCASDDVRAGDGCSRSSTASAGNPSVSQRRCEHLRMRYVATPDSEPLDIAAGAMRVRHEAREPASADDQYVACVTAGQIARCEQRSGCSAAQSQRFAIDHSPRFTAFAIEQSHKAR